MDALKFWRVGYKNRGREKKNEKKGHQHHIGGQ
jgi:hypothetical protein